MTDARSALLVPAYPGQPTVADLRGLAAAGKRPRKDYVELAGALDADVLDFTYMQEQASPAARSIARRVGLTAGQICEAFLRRARYRHVCAWADRIGLPLALLYKLTGSRRDLVLVSVWLSRPKKAVFLKRLKVQSHLGAIVNYGSVQMNFAREKLGVPGDRLHLAKQPVDDRFWRPQAVPTENLICAVGWEARDYPTLLEAASGLELNLHVAVGIAAFSSSKLEAPSSADDAGDEPAAAPQFGVMKGTFSYRFYEQWMEQVAREGLPANVTVSHQMGAEELRSLYASAKFVVIPLLDVDADCGVTALTEAMAMGKAVVLSRTRGQIDIMRDGEHGIYVPPGDPVAVREAIEHLVAHPDEAERMGRAGRQEVERHHSLDDYVARVARIIQASG
ncbi:MAG: glycosyltransferase family 4 protein [Actinomycetota bacterium]|nr:glycosyltransferase family 4 protein [Actinomycetota bacterium]